MNWTTPVRRILHTTFPDLWVSTEEPGFLILQSGITNTQVVDSLIEQLNKVFGGWSSLTHQSYLVGWISHEWVNGRNDFQLIYQPKHGVQFRFHF